jgi:hypothetical protein
MCAVCLASSCLFALFLKKVPRSATPGPNPNPNCQLAANANANGQNGPRKAKSKKSKEQPIQGARAIGPAAVGAAPRPATCFVPQFCFVVPVVRVPRGVPQKQIHHLVFALSYSH